MKRDSLNMIRQGIDTINPSNSLEFVVLIICLALLGGLFMWLKLGQNNKKVVKTNDEQNLILVHIQILETKFEGTMSEIKATIQGDYKLLKQRVDSLQNELTEFKKEVRGRENAILRD